MALHPIIYRSGDIFTAREQIIVNPVNCRGVMGKGLAAVYKLRYPEMFDAYKAQCKSGALSIGHPRLYTKSTPWILNFPTKDDPYAESQEAYIEAGLKYLIANHQKVPMESIAFPKLGTGEGKLTWEQVGPLMVRYLAQMHIPVVIYVAPGDEHYQAPVPLSLGDPISKQPWILPVEENHESGYYQDTRFSDTSYYYVESNGVVCTITNRKEWAQQLYRAICML